MSQIANCQLPKQVTCFCTVQIWCVDASACPPCPLPVRACVLVHMPALSLCVLLLCAAGAHMFAHVLLFPAAFKAQLADRRFQAGFKAWLGSTIALVVIAASYTSLLYLGRVSATQHGAA